MSDETTVTVRANAEILDWWEVGSEHTVARTPFVEKLIASEYVTVVDDSPDAEPEPLGGASATADMTVAVTAVPSADAGAEAWRRFLTDQGIPYSIDQAEDTEQLSGLWQQRNE